jgi:hypothetical protein
MYSITYMATCLMALGVLGWAWLMLCAEDHGRPNKVPAVTLEARMDLYQEQLNLLVWERSRLHRLHDMLAREEDERRREEWLIT